MNSGAETIRAIRCHPLSANFFCHFHPRDPGNKFLFKLSVGNILQVWIIYQNYYAHKFISQFKPSEKKCFRWLKVWRKLSQEFQRLMSQYLEGAELMPGAMIINTINTRPALNLNITRAWCLPSLGLSSPSINADQGLAGSRGSRIFTGELGRSQDF